MRETLQAVRGLCEAGAAQDGEVKTAFDLLLSTINWKAPLSKPDGDVAPLPFVQQQLVEACKHSGEVGSPARTLADAIAAEGLGLAWQGMYDEYEGEPDMDVFRCVYALTLLVGPDAPLQSDRLKVAITLQGSDILYPAHAHKQNEIYAVISGTADWRRGAEPWTSRPPGDFVFHPSGVRHAMQTNREPLLAFAAWLSDIHSEVVIVRG